MDIVVITTRSKIQRLILRSSKEFVKFKKQNHIPHALFQFSLSKKCTGLKLEFMVIT